MIKLLITVIATLTLIGCTSTIRGKKYTVTSGFYKECVGIANDYLKGPIFGYTELKNLSCQGVGVPPKYFEDFYLRLAE